MTARRALHLLCALSLLVCSTQASHNPFTDATSTSSPHVQTRPASPRQRRQLDMGAGLSPGMLPKEMDDMRVGIPGAGQMPEFVQDAIESLQNGHLPAMPMDTQPFVNGSIDTSTSSSSTTTSTMPGGGIVRIEHSMSMEVHGEGGTPTGGPLYLPKTACRPRQTVTSTVTVTKACSTAITRTRTKVNTVVETSTTTVTVSEEDTTTTIERPSAPASHPPSPPPPVEKPSTSQPPPAPPVQKPTSSTKSTSLAPPSSVSTKPPAPPPSSAPAAPPPSGPGPAAGFHSEVFASHNDWRAKYGAKALVWDADLASKADAWSKQCQFVHQEGFSSNLDSSGSTDGKPQLSGEAVLEHWVNGPNEKDSWDPNNPAGSHFTQVVWKGASKVGCAKFECNLSNYDPKFWPNAYAVCYYDIGNVAGQYTDNVGSLQS